MNELVFALLFGAGVVLAVGAYESSDWLTRAVASVTGVFWWVVLGNAVVSLGHITETGTTVVHGSSAAAWLFYLVAIAHLIAFVSTLVRVTQTADEETAAAANQLTDGVPNWPPGDD